MYFTSYKRNSLCMICWVAVSLMSWIGIKPLILCISHNWGFTRLMQYACSNEVENYIWASHSWWSLIFSTEKITSGYRKTNTGSSGLWWCRGEKQSAKKISAICFKLKSVDTYQEFLLTQDCSSWACSIFVCSWCSFMKVTAEMIFIALFIAFVEIGEQN